MLLLLYLRENGHFVIEVVLHIHINIPPAPETFAFLNQNQRVLKPAIAKMPNATPTPIPAFAPVRNAVPLVLELAVVVVVFADRVDGHESIEAMDIRDETTEAWM